MAINEQWIFTTTIAAHVLILYGFFNKICIGESFGKCQTLSILYIGIMEVRYFLPQNITPKPP